jgi:WD40 repeat protein
MQSYSTFALNVVELTSSSRSILYSAHVFWESKDCVLVAAGTAFGEIIYWSWYRHPDTEPVSRVHRVFLGHEGSIFGVRISKELPSGCCQTLKRIIASCSDDRTIRIWDVSDVSDVTTKTDLSAASHQGSDSERTHHTGFSNAAFDLESSSSSQCLAIGWGHASRVWKVQFLESTPCEGALLLLSAGEDASSRTWKLSPNNGEEEALPYKLIQQDSAAHHSGKNIWSSSIYGDSIARQRVVCGAADAKITSHPLVRISERTQGKIQEYTVLDVLSRAQLPVPEPGAETLQLTHKSSKRAEFFRSYCFLDHDSFLLTTNSGKVLLGSLQSNITPNQPSILERTIFIGQPDELSGFSVCTGDNKSRVAFVAGATGAIYMFSQTSKVFSKIGSVDGKIGEMFAANMLQSDDKRTVLLLVTLVGRKEALLLHVDIAADPMPCITRTIIVPISELLTGSTVTSMALAATAGSNYLYIGFRRGSVVTYRTSNNASESSQSATLIRVMEKIHGDETVTALSWIPSSANGAIGHLTSVGRDGCIAVQHIDLQANSIELVHNLTLPIGPNIEGLYYHKGHLVVHGFSSKKWVLCDITTEDEMMSVETGGGHRSWAFQPSSDSRGGGTLVWTRASSMHVCSQTGSNHSVIRPGGHGREIKAVAVSQGPSHHLIATGAEDTDIKIFEYIDGELLCQRTLRRHTTGIQHLQWSDNGEYLFSSGGCEEFYIWRIRRLPFGLKIGIVCELIYTPESEHSDLRIMSFDVTQRELGYDIAMVFSDSSIKVTLLCYSLIVCTNKGKGLSIQPRSCYQVATACSRSLFHILPDAMSISFSQKYFDSRY